MTQKTLEELKEILCSDTYKYCSLKNINDIPIVVYNKRGEYLTNGEEILKKLQNPLIPDGIYKVGLKNTLQAPPIEYGYTKGMVKNLSENTTTINPITLNIPPDFSQAIEHPAVKLQSEIARLNIENENLMNEVEELTKQLEELENELKNKATLSEEALANNKFETARTFFGEIVQVGVPLLDKYFQQKDAQIEIERAKLNLKPRQAPVNNYPQQDKELELQNKIKMWISSKADNEEIFNSLQALYYNSNNVQKFAERLKEFNNDLYEECRESVK